MTDKIYSIEEVANMFFVSPDTFRRWIRHGKAPKTFQVGQRYLIKDSDLQDWISKNEVQTIKD